MDHKHQEDAVDKSPAIMMIMALLATLAAVTAGTASPASANTSSQPPAILQDSTGATFIYNYDFLNEDGVAQDNVDWATSLVFWGSANINKIKGDLHNHGYDEISTNSMHMLLKNNGNPAVWDSDAGKKDIMCPLTGDETRHYRIYAEPGSDTLWSPDLGYFVVATTHWDGNECPPINTRFWGSEEVEGHIGQTMFDLGYLVEHDYGDFQNYEPYRVEGKSTWENNGYATYVQVF